MLYLAQPFKRYIEWCYWRASKVPSRNTGSCQQSKMCKNAKKNHTDKSSMVPQLQFLSWHSKVCFFCCWFCTLLVCSSIYQNNWICKYLLFILVVLHLYYLLWHELSCIFIFLYCILHWLLPRYNASLWVLIIKIYWLSATLSSTTTEFLNATIPLEIF